MRLFVYCKYRAPGEKLEFFSKEFLGSKRPPAMRVEQPDSLLAGGEAALSAEN